MIRHYAKPQVTTSIPTQLSKKQFKKFILPRLSLPKRGAKCKRVQFVPFQNDQAA
jgi:hypothetical protein